MLLVGLVLNWIVVGVGAVIADHLRAPLGRRVATREMRGRPMPEPPAGPVQTEGAELGPTVYSGAEKELLEEHPERYSRNKFLELSTLGIGAAIGAVVTIPVVGFAIAPSFVDQGDEDVDVGPLSNYPEGEFVVTTFQSREDGGKVSTRTAYIRNNGFVNSVPSFTILSSSCVHLGCPVQPSGPLGEPQDIETDSGKVTLIGVTPAGFSCPCHGGAYDTEGNRTAGPPVRSLDRYYFKIDNANLVLAGRYSVGTVKEPAPTRRSPPTGSTTRGSTSTAPRPGSTPTRREEREADVAAVTSKKPSARRQGHEGGRAHPRSNWLEERSGLIGGVRYFLFRNVPSGHSAGSRRSARRR